MKQANTLNSQEFKRLMSVSKDGKYGIRDACIVIFSFYLGLRVKEIASIPMSSVIDTDGQINDSFYITPEQSKNDGRHVYLTNKVVRKALTDYIDWRQDKTSSKLFWTQKGGCFTPKSLQMWFDRLYKKAGFTGCSSHSGRRTFATNLISKGYDIKSVSVLMGHKSIQHTSRYIQTNPILLGDMVSSL